MEIWNNETSLAFTFIINSNPSSVSSKFAMRSTFFISLFSIILSISTELNAQNIPLGTWRNHSAYLPSKGLAIREGQIFSLSQNGLFRLDTESNSLEHFSKIDGLSEGLFADIAYNPESENLIIAYQNANIDLIKAGEVLELPLIRDATITGSKQINDIYTKNELAYLSSDFGVVVIDLRREEIRETYRNLAPGGNPLEIYAATISADSLFLASAQGVLCASLSDNLLDFSVWRFFSGSEGLPAQPVRHLVSREGEVFAAIEGAGLYRYTHQNQWEIVAGINTANLQGLDISDNHLLICQSGQIQQIAPDDNLSIWTDPLLLLPQEAALRNGELWVTDLQNGLLRKDTNQQWQQFAPNGTARPEVQRLLFTEGEVRAFAGGYDQNKSPRGQRWGYYAFREGLWQNYNAYDAQNAQSFPNMSDILKVQKSPRSDTLIIASFGEGLGRYAPNTQALELWQASNSPLNGAISGGTRISDFSFDSEGNLWLCNTGISSGLASLHQIRNDGRWQSYTPSSSSGRNPERLLIDGAGFKWITLQNSGIWLLNSENNQQIFLNDNPAQGALPSRQVNALAEDRNGQIWVGTNEGIAVFFSGFDVFNGNLSAFRPIFENRPLLRAEQINCLAVDAGNRKWVGTNTGAWLFSPDGSELIHYFNVVNSPLASNQILDIAIDAASGEVFFASAAGIQSYRSDAGIAGSNFSGAKIFPNPVPPNYAGLVGISGLMEDSRIKITDISGKLIYEAIAQGGTLSWDLQDYTGHRATNGIYLVFANNQDGSETFVGKIAIIE